MAKVEFNREKRSFLYNFIIVSAILILFILVTGIIREYLRQIEMNKEIASLEDELQKLNWGKKDFLQSIDEYQSDYFVEEQARTAFNLKKEGEKVIVISPDELASVRAEKLALKERQLVENRTVSKNAKLWWTYFFGPENI